MKRNYDYLILLWTTKGSIENHYEVEESELYVIPWDYHVPEDIDLICGIKLGEDHNHYHEHRVDELLAFVHDSLKDHPQDRLFPKSIVPDWHHYKINPNRNTHILQQPTGAVMIVTTGVDEDEWTEKRLKGFVETLQLRAEEKEKEKSSISG